MRKSKGSIDPRHPLLVKIVVVTLTTILTTVAATFGSSYREQLARRRRPGWIEGTITGAVPDGATIVLDDGNETKKVLAGSNTFRFETVAPGMHTVQIRLNELPIGRERVMVHGDSPSNARLVVSAVVSPPDQAPVAVELSTSAKPNVPAARQAGSRPGPSPVPRRDRPPRAEALAPAGPLPPQKSESSAHSDGNLARSAAPPSVSTLPCDTADARAPIPAEPDAIEGAEPKEYRDLDHIRVAEVECKAKWNHVATNWSIQIGVRRWDCECRR